MTITEMKTALIRRGSGQAIELLDVTIRDKPDSLKAWLKKGSTVELRRLAAPYKTYSIYDQRKERLPFFNDVCAIDSVWLKLKNKEA